MEHGLDLERTAPRRRHPSARGEHPHPRLSIGYTQGADGDVTELQTIDSRESFVDNGLPLDATLELNPGDITTQVDVRGQAPVRLVASDGRVSQFPRVWAAVSTGDGCRGVGWLEWNRNLGERIG